MRTGMWSALQATLHLTFDPSLAVGEKRLDDSGLLSGRERRQEAEEDGEEVSETAKKGEGGDKPAKEEVKKHFISALPVGAY